MKYNPWRGILSYQSTDVKNFKGRMADVSKFLEMVYAGNMSVLYADSGIGKTSFMNAGITPFLSNDHYSPVSILFPDAVFQQNDDIEAWLVEECRRNFKWTPLIDTSRFDEAQLSLLAECEHSLWWLLHTNTLQDGSRPVFYFDQFEEVFSKSRKYNNANFNKQLFRVFEELSSDIVPEHILITLNRLATKGRNLKVDRTIRYKVVFSLRKEYLADFDYWTNDRYSIPLLQKNRMLLLPLDRKQAEEVITRQPMADQASLCVETLNAIKDDIINKIDTKGLDEVEPVILSVLCNRLYQIAVEKGKVATGLSKDDLDKISIESIISTFYEQGVRRIVKGRKLLRRLEDKLVDKKGIRRRPDVRELIAMGFSLDDLNALKDAHIIRTEKSLTALQQQHPDQPDAVPEKIWVELIHDRIAEVIWQKRQREDRSKKSRTLQGLLAAFVVLAALATLLWGGVTTNKDKMKGNLVRCEDHHFTTNDSLWIAEHELADNAQVEQLDIIDSDHFTVRNCPYLTSIDLTRIGSQSLTLNLSNCPQLSNLVMPDRLDSLQLDIDRCPQLKVFVGKGLGELKVNSPNDSIEFYVDGEVERYVWQNKVLWDLENRGIAYYFLPKENTQQNEIRLAFPSQIAYPTITYQGVKFVNTAETDQKEEDEVSSSYSYSQHFRKHENPFLLVTPSRINRDVNYVELPDSMPEILSGLFSQCFQLDSVWIPPTVKNIGKSAFQDCRRLQAVNLPPSLLNIEAEAFKNCKQLEEVVIPASVDRIGDMAFAGCTALRSVVFLGQQVRLGARAFAFCPALVDVKLPQQVQYADSGYFGNPFLQSPVLQRMPELAGKAKAAVAARDGKTLFTMSHVILLDEEAHELHIPVSLPRWNWTIMNDPSALTDIYVPYPQPDMVYRTHLSGTLSGNVSFRLGISDELKGKITLHVPHGSRRYYKIIPEFSRYRQIEEMSRWQSHLLYVKSVLMEMVTIFNYKLCLNIAYLVGCFLLGLFVIHLRQRIRKDQTPSQRAAWLRYALAALLYALLILVVYLILYYALLLLFGAGNEALTIAGLGSFVIVTASFLMDEICAYASAARINMRLPRPTRLATQFRKYAKGAVGRWWYALLACLFAGLAAVGLVWCNHAPNVSEAMAAGQYEKALCVLADQVMAKDSFTAADAAMLRSIFLLSTPSSRLTKVDEVKYDNGPSLVFSEERPCLSVSRHDTLFVWNEKQVKCWDMKYDPFGQGSLLSDNLCDGYVTYYNANVDSSAIFEISPSPADKLALRVKGKVTATYHSLSYIFTQSGTSRLLYDRQGRSIRIPSDYESASPNINYGTVVEVKPTSTGGWGSSQPAVFYGLTPQGPVCHAFPNGSIEAYCNGRFLVWKEANGNKTRVYDVYESFRVVREYTDANISLKAIGKYLALDRGNKTILNDFLTGDSIVLDGRISASSANYILTDRKSVYMLPQRVLQPLGTKYDNISYWNAYICDDQYLLLFDCDYGVTHVFNLHDRAKAIGEIRGKLRRNLNSPSPTDLNGFICVKFGDSLAWYPLHNDRMPSALGNGTQAFGLRDEALSSGLRLPLSRLERCSRLGDYLIEEVSQDETYAVYSLRDTISRPAYVYGHRPLVFGDNILVLTNDWSINIFREATLQELIMRSRILSERQKQGLIRLLPNS